MANIDELDAIPIVESKQFDARPYKGFKTKIIDVAQEATIDFYTGPEDANGRPTYNAMSTVMKEIITIYTEKLPELDENGNATAIMTDIQVKRKFNLMKKVDEVSGKINWVIGKDPRAHLWKFMRNNDVEKLSQLMNKQVVLGVEADKLDANKYWLRISD